MPTEADTCRKFVLPKLYAASWNDDQIAEQRTFTDGRIVVHGNRATRRRPKRVDYLLRYTRDFPIAVVEAKAAFMDARDGLQQAKEYTEILKLRFAYATNGRTIVEFDFATGLEREIPEFPTPDDLWLRLRTSEKLIDDSSAARLLTPLNLTTGKEPRYYQQIAVHRVVTQWDAAGWRPSKDEFDRYGREIPDEVYTAADFERRIALRARTQGVARHLTEFLKKTDRFAKTIVFCVDQEHASEMRAALNNLNTDLVAQASRLMSQRFAMRMRSDCLI
jgi:type I site-specific restriction endonuclease